jgi:hypothetical protein
MMHTKTGDLAMQSRRNNAMSIVAAGIFGLVVSLAAPPDAIAQTGDSPDRNPWRAELCTYGDCEGIPASLTAPANRSIVIDTFSGECSVPNAGVFRGMRSVLNDTILHLFIPDRTMVGFSHTIHDWNKQTRMVIPANGTFRIDAFAISGAPDITYCRFYLTGYTLKP